MTLEVFMARHLFSRRGHEFAEPSRLTSFLTQKLDPAKALGFIVGVAAVAGLLCGILTGTVFVPGRFELHEISFANHPVWYFSGMAFNAIVTACSAAFFWRAVRRRK